MNETVFFAIFWRMLAAFAVPLAAAPVIAPASSAATNSDPEGKGAASRGAPTPADSAPAIQFDTTPSGVRFGIWPQRPAKPAPTLFVLATSIEDTLASPDFRQAGQYLAKEGWLCVSVDLPCHGQETRPEELHHGLRGWRARCDRNEDVVANATGRLSQVLDYLIAKNLADPKRVGALGTSRGGFIALHFAAADPRVRCVAGFAPVTDLAVLTEFHGAKNNPLVQRLALERQAEALAGRAVWLVVGDRDERVATDRVIRFARRVTEVSLERMLPALVDVHVISTPKGHTTPDGSAEQAAEWFKKQLPGRR